MTRLGRVWDDTGTGVKLRCSWTHLYWAVAAQWHLRVVPSHAVGAARGPGSPGHLSNHTMLEFHLVFHFQLISTNGFNFRRADVGHFA